MIKSAEFWLRISSVLFLLGLICMAPTVLFPFGVSLFLAVLLSPLAKWIQRGIRKMGIRKWPYDASIILSFAIFLGCLYFIGIHVVLPFVEEFRDFVQNVPIMLDMAQKIVPQWEADYSLRLMPQELKDVLAKLAQELGQYTLRLAQFSISAIFSLAGTMLELVVVPFITFYFIKSGKTFSLRFIKFFPRAYHNHLLHLFKEIHFVLHAYIRGQLLLSVLMTAVVFLGMWMMDIPYPLVIGLLSGLMEMLPVVGPIIAAIPPLLLGLMQGSAEMLQVLVFYVVVQQLDSHLLMPKLMGRIIRVHPIAIIAGVLIGGQLYGVIGMMISVPAVAVIQVLLKHTWYYDTHKRKTRRIHYEKIDNDEHAEKENQRE